MLTCGSDRGRALALACVAAAGLAALAPPAAQGLTYTWVNAAGGASNVGGNWDRGSPPGVGDAVHFGPLSAYTTSFSGGDTYASLAATAGSPTFSVFNTLTFTGGAVVNGGALSLGHPTIPAGLTGQVSAFNWQVGNGAASTLVVSGGHTTAYSADSASGSFLGNLGNATVTLQTGGAFNSNGSIEIGTQAASTCSTYVTGFLSGAFGSASALRTLARPNFGGWVDRGRLVVGAVGHGGVNVDNGAIVYVATDLTLGKFPGSIGFLRLSAKSGATRTPSLFVGRQVYLGSTFGGAVGGTGVLSIEAGTAQATFIEAGYLNEPVGPVRARILLHQGATLISKEIELSPGLTGSLELRGGVLQLGGDPVLNYVSNIRQSAPFSISSVVGTPKLWIVDGSVCVVDALTPLFGIGRGGTGTVRVAGPRATLECRTDAVMADSTGGFASLEVDSGGAASFRRRLQMGNSATSSALVRNGSVLSAKDLRVGLGATLTAVGPGTRVQADSALFVSSYASTYPATVFLDSNAVLFGGPSLVRVYTPYSKVVVADGARFYPTNGLELHGTLLMAGGWVQADSAIDVVDVGVVRGYGTILGPMRLDASGATLTVTPDDPKHDLLVVGDPNRADGFSSTAGGTTNVADDTLEIHNAGGVDLGRVLLAEGTLRLPQGGRVGPTDTLYGGGRVEGLLLIHGTVAPGLTGTLQIADTLRCLDGRIANGTLDVAPGGTLSMRGAHTASLLLEGDLDMGPAPARLALTGSATLASGSRLGFRLGSRAAGVQDTLAFSGTVVLGGTLDLQLAPGYVHTVGDTFTVATAGSFIGAFSAVRFNGSPGAGIVTVLYGLKSVRVVIVGAALAVEPGPSPAATPRALRLATTGVPLTSALALELPTPARVRIALYDVTGREVAVLADGDRAAGRYALPLGDVALPAGIYFARAMIVEAHGVKALTARVVRLR